MANVEWLKELRGIGVKRAVFSEQAANGEAKLLEVEFFPQSALDFGGRDADTIMPPAPADDEDGPPNAQPVAPAMARIMKRGSVS